MKAAKEHRVALGKRAIEILTALPNDSEFVFMGGRAGKPLSNMALLELMRGMKPGFVPHGFRSTFRDWAAERTAYPGEVVEMALAHAIESKVEAASRRGDLFEKRRRLMADWAGYCAAPVEAAKLSRFGVRLWLIPVAQSPQPPADRDPYFRCTPPHPPIDGGAWGQARDPFVSLKLAKGSHGWGLRCGLASGLRAKSSNINGLVRWQADALSAAPRSVGTNPFNLFRPAAAAPS